VYAVFAFVTVPFLIFVLPRTVPSLHPSDSIVNAELEFTMSGSIRLVLFASLVAFGGLFSWIYSLARRVRTMIRKRDEE
jgi:heme exporter protein C